MKMKRRKAIRFECYENAKKRIENKSVKIEYVEPLGYFSDEARKKFGLGEYAESNSLIKIKAVMLGHAVGDALGVPVEFCAREELTKDPVTDMRGWGSHSVPSGCWSDDTSMSLATLDALTRKGIDYNAIMENFVRWINEQAYTATGEVFDTGRTCLAAIRKYLKSEERIALSAGMKNEYSCGNGALMRIHPMALYLYFKGYEAEEAIEIIHQTTMLTHAHTRAKVASGIYAFILWELLDSPCRASVIRGLKKCELFYTGKKTGNDKIIQKLRDPDLTTEEKNALVESLYEGIDIIAANEWEKEFDLLSEKLKRIASDPCGTSEVSSEEIKSSGYVADTLEAAIWCVMTTKDYKSCVLKAVNLGEDADTVAAVAGGLAGALYGYEAIPKKWLEGLLMNNYIEELCTRAAEAWQRA